jgi:hypothetical protein
VLFPPKDDDDDSDYDPDQDDAGSYTSSEDSDYEDDGSAPSDDDDVDSVDDPTTNPDLSAFQPPEITGVDRANRANITANTEPGTPPGVEPPGHNTEVDHEPPGMDHEIPGVDHGTPGVDNTDLETYVNELEAELDEEIAAIDSDYDPNVSSDSDSEPDNSVPVISKTELAALHANATREQANADQDMDEEDDSESDNSSSDEADAAPLSRLRRNRTRNYRHLKGHDDDGSLPTVARPHEFRGGKHQARMILQSIIFTQYNLKQGIKKFGDDGKAAVLIELQQLYDRKVMMPVNKYDLTPAERKGALRYLMFLK